MSDAEPRNLVICVDGTNNEIAVPNTNVYRLFRALSEDNQVRFYQPGVGTLVNERALYKLSKLPGWFNDSATGASMREGFINAYAFLVNHWRPGDRIYFFGFSRGAYTVRALAGALKVFGLPRPEQANVIPYIWQEYTDSALRVGRTREPVFRYGNRLQRDFCVEGDIPIHFLGVWDTVSSLGKISAFKSLPHTRENDLIATIRHAVAVDEKRGVFQANLFQTSGTKSDVRQCWFPGYHTDVGGGHPTEENGLGMITFEWMIEHAGKAGLRLDPKILKKIRAECKPSATANIHNSMDFVYSLLEFLPIRKFDFMEKGLAWQAPHLFRSRRIPEGDEIHPAVEERMKADLTYRPQLRRIAPAADPPLAPPLRDED